MNWGLISLGFVLGTFKFLFGHWSLYLAFEYHGFQTLVEIFVSVTAGAWAMMTPFYFGSSYFMRRAKLKRELKEEIARAKGIEIKRKKKFTWMNKTIVKVKSTLGIYGITFLAPLFLSIPGGAVVCAKFFGGQKKTFPLMLLFTTCFSTLMCFSIYLYAKFI